MVEAVAGHCHQQQAAKKSRSAWVRHLQLPQAWQLQQQLLPRLWKRSLLTSTASMFRWQALGSSQQQQVDAVILLVWEHQGHLLSSLVVSSRGAQSSRSLTWRCLRHRPSVRSRPKAKQQQGVRPVTALHWGMAQLKPQLPGSPGNSRHLLLLLLLLLVVAFLLLRARTCRKSSRKVKGTRSNPAGSSSSSTQWERMKGLRLHLVRAWVAGTAPSGLTARKVGACSGACSVCVRSCSTFDCMVLCLHACVAAMVSYSQV